MGQQTQFLNVDLDVVGARDLSPLVSALEARGVYCLHHQQHDDGWRASFEIAGGAEAPDTTIERLAHAIRTLESDVRELWDGAQERTFDIGIEAGAEPHAYHAALGSQVLAAIADLSARLVITVYGARHEPERSR